MHESPAEGLHRDALMFSCLHDPDNWFRNQENEYCSPLSFQLEGMMKKETGRAVDHHLPPSTVSPGEFCGFVIMGWFMGHQTCFKG